MSKHLKEEYKLFIKDIEKNIKNKEDIAYIKERIDEFLDETIKELDKLYNKLEEDGRKLESLEERQQKLDLTVNNIQKVLNNIENDIYAEDGFDFEIVCPYCTGEFLIDVDENKTEVKCPECNNIVELDWSGDIENDKHSTCGGGCSHCASDCEEEQDDEDDM